MHIARIEHDVVEKMNDLGANGLLSYFTGIQSICHATSLLYRILKQKSDLMLAYHVYVNCATTLKNEERTTTTIIGAFAVI
jgi:hypothetical protein